MKKNLEQQKGLLAALASALFLGLAPVFGKQAMANGFTPFAVVALRTGLAALLLLLVLAAFRRQFLYIFPVGLAGCMLAGIINGVGSIFYYMALQRLDASIGQLLYSLYPLFVAIWLVLDRQPPTRMTTVRILLGVVAVSLLILAEHEAIDLIGVGFMIAASALYALHLPINQRVLYEIPAPTVTLYTLLAMSAVVVPAYFLFDFGPLPVASLAAWGPLAGLTLVTFFSRLTLFLGVKHLGGMQTALLGLAELIVTLFFSYLWLKESLSPLQAMGAVILGISLALIAVDKSGGDRRRRSGGWLSWIRAPGMPRIPWDVQHE